MQRNQQKQKVNRTWLHVHWLFSLIDIYVQTRCSSTLEGNNKLYEYFTYNIGQCQWVEFNAPPDTIQVISEADTLGVLYISYSVVDDQRHK